METANSIQARLAPEDVKYKQKKVNRSYNALVMLLRKPKHAVLS